MMKGNVALSVFLIIQHPSAAFAASCGPTVSVTLRPCNISIPDLNTTVYSWGTHLVINRTELCAAPSTYSASPLLEHWSVCEVGPDKRGDISFRECISRRGNVLKKGEYEALRGSAVQELNETNRNWVSFTGPFEDATTSPIQLLPDLSLAVTSGLITHGDQHTQSHLSLNEKSTILEDLYRHGHITERSFSLDVGSESYYSPHNGQITFGGYDPGRVRGQFPEFNINKDNLKLQDRFCPLQVHIETLTADVGGKTIKLISSDNDSPTCIEPYDRVLRLPETNLEQLQGALDAVPGVKLLPATESGRYGDILDSEPGLVYMRDQVKVPVLTSMRITLQGGLTVILNEEDLIQPLVGLDSNGTRAVNESYAKIMVYQKPGQGKAPVLGRVFLSKLYTYVNYDTSKIRMGLLDTEAASPQSLSQCSEHSASPGISGPEIAGIVLGGLALILAAVGFFWLRNMRGRFRSEAVKLEELTRKANQTTQQPVNPANGGATLPGTPPIPH